MTHEHVQADKIGIICGPGTVCYEIVPCKLVTGSDECTKRVPLSKLPLSCRCKLSEPVA